MRSLEEEFGCHIVLQSSGTLCPFQLAYKLKALQRGASVEESGQVPKGLAVGGEGHIWYYGIETKRDMLNRQRKVSEDKRTCECEELW